jgi:hypothetical protein
MLSACLNGMFPIVKMRVWVEISTSVITSDVIDSTRRPSSVAGAWPLSSRRCSRRPITRRGIAGCTPRWFARGDGCGPELVRDIMRELGLVPCQPRPWRPTTSVPLGQDTGLHGHA